MRTEVPLNSSLFIYARVCEDTGARRRLRPKQKSRFDHFTASQSLFIPFRSPRDAAIHVYQLRNRLQRAWGSHNSQKNGKRCTNIRHEWCRKSPRIFLSVLPKSFRKKPPIASHAYMHRNCLFTTARSWAKENINLSYSPDLHKRNA